MISIKESRGNKKVAVVTGGARGIGRAIAKTFLKDDIHVIIADILPMPEVFKEETNVSYYSCDISDLDDLNSFVEGIHEEFDRIDILVNNAATGFQSVDLVDMSLDHWDEVHDTNLRSAAFLSKKLLEGMIEKRSGVIINISSSSSYIPEAGHTAYASSKAGLEAFTRCLAREVGIYGIRVIAVVPGCIETETNTLSPEEKKTVSHSISLGRIGKAEEIAKVVKFLISDSASYITGQSIIVDGGEN